jgi:hypothetical protein
MPVFWAAVIFGLVTVRRRIRAVRGIGGADIGRGRFGRAGRSGAGSVALEVSSRAISGPTDISARDMLDRRYAEGLIDTPDYRERRTTLDEMAAYAETFAAAGPNADIEAQLADSTDGFGAKGGEK